MTPPAPAAIPLLLRRAQQRRGGRDRHGSCRDRMLVGAGKDRDAAILLDAHRHFRADEIEAFGAHMAAQQAQAGDAAPRLSARSPRPCRRRRARRCRGYARRCRRSRCARSGCRRPRRDGCCRNSLRSRTRARASRCRAGSDRWQAATTARESRAPRQRRRAPIPMANRRNRAP